MAKGFALVGFDVAVGVTTAGIVGAGRTGAKIAGAPDWARLAFGDGRRGAIEASFVVEDELAESTTATEGLVMVLSGAATAADVSTGSETAAERSGEVPTTGGSFLATVEVTGINASFLDGQAK